METSQLKMLSLYVIQINWFWVTIQLTQLYCAVVVAVSIANYDGFWCYRMFQSVSRMGVGCVLVTLAHYISATDDHHG